LPANDLTTQLYPVVSSCIQFDVGKMWETWVNLGEVLINFPFHFPQLWQCRNHNYHWPQ